MATLLNPESRRLYSWWWDSHISPKNSKWLKENLSDMDTKVKAMIKLIEEDADSFAKRAEMYYRKRPELMKLVEELYRAYRALAERYDHATGDLRQAHRTMAEAFPNHVPFVLGEDSPAKSSEPHTPVHPHPIRAFFDPDDLQNDPLSASDVHHFWKAGQLTGESDSEKLKSGLKQLHEMFEAANMLPLSAASADGNVKKYPSQECEQKEQSLQDELSQLLIENQDLKAKNLSKSERCGEAESQVQNLEDSLSKIRNEKEFVLVQYQQCLEKLSDLERELSHAQEDARRLNEKASSAETHVQRLKESLINLEAEKDASINMHEDSLRRIYYLEVKAAQAQENVNGLSERAKNAENESQHLKAEISRLKSEKEAGLHQYDLCLKRICDLENNILAAEENAKFFKERADGAETEVRRLREALAALSEEKEESALQYKHCLEKVAKLEEELACAREDVARLNTEVLEGAAKLKNAEKECALLEMSNQTLRQEAENLLRRITSKDNELSVKQEELDKLQVRVQHEHLRYAQIEGTLHTLQNLHSQSQDDQRALTLELKNGIQMLKDVETSKHSLENELQHVRDENNLLNQQKLTSTITIESLESEICSLRGMKERLEEEVAQQMGCTTSLQQEIFSLQEEIKGLNGSYQSLVVQVESVGLKPNEVGSSIEHLQDENSKLRETCEKNNHEKEDLSKKLENMGGLLKKNAILESSVAAVNAELESTRENMRLLQESCQSLSGEKSSLVAEKATILSQLQILTESMQNLLQKNAVLENSFSGAQLELEGLREKSKGLEEICQLLKSEKDSLLAERSTLAITLENIERRLEYLEKRFTGLEEKCAGLEKEKETVHSQVEELRFSLSLEKQERSSCMLQNQSRFTSLENNIHLLQEENQWRRKQFDEELDKGVKSQFEIYVLQKFIKDMEEKNYSLLVECQKHVEASNLAEQFISELESENLEQQMEAELLLDEIQRLRLDIYQIYQALDTGSVRVLKDKAVNEQYFVPRILKDIKAIKLGLSESEDSHHKLVLENSVLLSLLDQLKLDRVEVESQKASLKSEVETMTEKLKILQNDQYELQDMNRLLQLEVTFRIQKASAIQSKLDNLLGERGALQEAHIELQKQFSQVLEENRSLLEKLSSFMREKGQLVQENDSLLLETLNLLSIFTVWKSIGEEMKTGLNLLSEDLHNLQGANFDLKTEIRGRLEMKEAENQLLTGSVERLEMELQGTRESNSNLMHEISCGEEILRHKEAALVETEKRVETAENLNSELCKTVDELKTECQESTQMMEKMEKQIMELSEQTINQNNDIESLCELNRILDSEVGKLSDEIQEQIIREEDLTSKLEEKNNETELWEAEAATFYFDLQLSSICEVLYENKVQELSGICEIMEDESASKTVEIQQMKETISSLEGELGGLKSEIDIYESHIASLADDVASLEMNAFHQLKFNAPESAEEKSPQSVVDPHGSYREKGGQLNPSNGIQDLKRLQTTIKAIEKVVLQEMQHMSWESPKSRKSIPEDATNEIEELSYYERNKKQSGKSSHEKEHSENVKPRKARLRASDCIQMKDIPLDRNSSKSKYRVRRRNNLEAGRSDDQMLELWETSEDSVVKSFGKPARKSTETKQVYDQITNLKQRSRHPSAELEMEKELGIDKLTIVTSPPGSNQEGNNRKILERLASDAEKLADLQIIVQGLRRKLNTNKKTTKSKDFDFETVKEQLLEVEETVVQMADLNGQLMKTTEEGSPFSVRKTSGELKDTLISIRLKKISDQARKGSEKIGRLQLEVQKIRYMLLKLEDDKKTKGSSRFSRSKTTIILRDFIYNRKKRGSGKRKKSRLCGCFSRPSSSRDGHRISCSSPNLH
ncbi:hypothetical protein LIER_15826 [Lithospermum erythrorhizon]|uniref:NAB domain-containing protein n=1 Tax=Lithospermum erythrorhizon TaxID=34254 RepID=A0AAV3Q5A6_LITER